MKLKKVKRLLIALFIFISILCLCWYTDYQYNLQPKLLFSMEFDAAKELVPDIAAWKSEAMPWE